MSIQTLSFLNVIARAFENKDFSSLAQNFTYPLPIYVHDGLLVFGAAETLVEVLDEYRTFAAKHGIVKLVPRIVAEGMPVNRRSHLWVEWDHLDKDGTCQRTSLARLVLTLPLGSVTPKIETVEYRVAAFPELVEQLPLALPA